MSGLFLILTTENPVLSKTAWSLELTDITKCFLHHDTLPGLYSIYSSCLQALLFVCVCLNTLLGWDQCLTDSDIKDHPISLSRKNSRVALAVCFGTLSMCTEVSSNQFWSIWLNLSREILYTAEFILMLLSAVTSPISSVFRHTYVCHNTASTSSFRYSL